MRAGTCQSPSSPTRAIIDLEEWIVKVSPKSTRDQASLDSGSSREKADHSDMDTASEDCISCSDTDEVSIQTAHKRYQKWVWASCKLSKDNLWMEAQLKRISDKFQDAWRHNHKSNIAEQKYASTEDHNSFEMKEMTVRTDQLLHIAEGTGSKIYTRELDAKIHGRVKTLVLLLKQYHIHYYQFYEKGTTRAMVGIQGLHMSNAFQHSNMSTSIGLNHSAPRVSS